MTNIIEVKNLKKYYGNVKAVDDISFTVEKGELFGFLGVNGAGKSTTINMLCTLFPPTEGTAAICGYPIGTATYREGMEIRKRIGVVYQNNCLDNRLSVKENLTVRGFLYENNKKKIERNLGKVSEVLSLGDILKRPYGKLSGGQKRRCEIAAALMHAPEVLFLDEPTTGLDPATRKSVWQSVATLRKEMQMTVFLTTHYMEEAAKASHIAIIDNGKIKQYGTPFSLKNDFARDNLRLVAGEDKEREEQIKAYLEKKGIAYKDKEEFISVSLNQTAEALPVLKDLEGYITGFEVMQGTLDDVFLNVTGKGLED